jgi:hypothetical protein
MDWQALLWIGGLIVLFFVMMRGCGGMSGGCGMGSRRDTSTKWSDASAGADERRDKHHAA